ncbi:MAG: DMT family transporter [Pseudomonadota bacterium]
MTELTPIALALFSAVTLAATNAVVKAGNDVFAGRVILAGFSSALLLPATLLVPLPNVATLSAIGLSCCAHAVYQLGLVKALQPGDLSLVFPIMRGCAPLGVAIGAWLVFGETLSPLAFAGLLAATGGVIGFALPYGHLGGTRLDRATLAWSLLTALGIALYSVADARGIRAEANPFTFIVWLFIAEGLWLNTLALMLRGNGLIAAYRSLWRFGISAAIGAILSYGAMLLAFYSYDTARASALRETSIVFAALFGAVFLGESFGRRRTALAALVAAGLVVMQLF